MPFVDWEVASKVIIGLEEEFEENRESELLQQSDEELSQEEIWQEDVKYE